MDIHKGFTLNKIEKLDFVVDLEIYTCPHCKVNLENTKIEDTKVIQIFDIPEIKILVTEYRSQVKICPHCREKAIAKFPSNVTSPT